MLATLGARALQRYFSTFPAGLPGIGLLLLRVSLGVSAAAPAAAHLCSRDGGAGAFSVAVLAGVCGVALAVGLLTPLAGTVVAAATLAGGAGANPSLLATVWPIAAAAVAMALLGPGAYSIDARLFGRREIVISHAPRR